MARTLASIQKVESISPIEGKDMIKLAKILGWNVIVDSSIEVNEHVVFIEVDSVLPVKAEFEFLRKRCYSESQGGFVIKTMKMGGVISQGIVFHIKDVLPEAKYKINTDVTDIIGIKQREDNADVGQAPKKPKTYFETILYRLGIPQYIKSKCFISGDFPTKFISKSDEIRIQSLGNSFLEQHLGKSIVITEKLEGQSATYICKKIRILGFPYYYFKSYGRNTAVYPNHNIYNYAIENNVKQKMIKILKDDPSKTYIAIQGEMVGPKIQGNIYDLEKHEFFVFKIRYNKKEMCFGCLKNLCDVYRFTHVPVIMSKELTRYLDVDYWVKLSTGTSVLANRLREGIVIRSMKLNDAGFTDFSFKAVSPEYCLERGY